MGATVNVIVAIDASGLNRGLAVAAQYSRRTVPQLVNTAAYWVAVNTKAGTPFVTVEKIDAELAVIAHPVIGKRGAPLKKKKRYTAAGQSSGAPPLAVMIIQARASGSSKYNWLTSFRYAAASPFKGKSAAAGRAAMAAALDLMIKQRHRSGKFLLAGWVQVVQQLLPYTAQKFLPGGARANEGKSSYYGGRLGQAQPAPSESFTCVATIENDIGLEGKNRASMNRALLQYGAGPLQAALDREGERQMAYALRKMEEELARTVAPHWT